MSLFRSNLMSMGLCPFYSKSIYPLGPWSLPPNPLKEFEFPLFFLNPSSSRTALLRRERPRATFPPIELHPECPLRTPGFRSSLLSCTRAERGPIFAFFDPGLRLRIHVPPNSLPTLIFSFPPQRNGQERITSSAFLLRSPSTTLQRPNEAKLGISSFLKSHSRTLKFPPFPGTVGW